MAAERGERLESQRRINEAARTMGAEVSGLMKDEKAARDATEATLIGLVETVVAKSHGRH